MAAQSGQNLWFWRQAQREGQLSVPFVYRSCTGVLKDQTDLFRLTYALEVVKATGWKYLLLSDKLWKEAAGLSQAAAAVYIQQSQLDACFNDAGHQIVPLEICFVGHAVALVNVFAECELTLLLRDETIAGLQVVELQLCNTNGARNSER